MYTQRRPTKANGIALLKNLGLEVKTVIDVGVHITGTKALLTTFPEKKHVLVEPVEEFRESIMELYKPLKEVDYICAAASNVSGTFPLEIKNVGDEPLRANNIAHSLLVDEVKEGQSIRHVKVITIDELCREKSYEGPFLLKVDVDGKDLEVLQGATEVLKETVCVVIEATLSRLTERGCFLERQGFLLWDICDLLYFDDCLWQVDLIYLKNKFFSDPKKKLVPWADPKRLAEGSWYEFK